MQRPEKIYLDEPITISGTKVGHTESGLKYLIDHMQHVLSFPVNEAKIKAADRQHIEKLIATYTFHLQVYEHERTTKTPVQLIDVQENKTNDQRKEDVSECVAQLHDHGNGNESG